MACSVEGCDGKAHCRGWCQKHYQRWRKYGDPAHPTKLPLTSTPHGTLSGYSNWKCRCDLCRAVTKAYSANYYKRKEGKWGPNDTETRREFYLRLRYALSPADYQNLEDMQGGVCAICWQPETYRRLKKLAVDHDHKTGKIRGLLCNRCNAAIGKFEDNPELLTRAASYLLTARNKKRSTAMEPAELVGIRKTLTERTGSADEDLVKRIYNCWVDLNADTNWQGSNFPTLEAIINRYLAGPDPGIVPF